MQLDKYEDGKFVGRYDGSGRKAMVQVKYGTASRGKELQHRGINRKEACDIVCLLF